MIILISGATHTGKTRIAQKLLEKCKYPYLSIDHLKMGLIRSGNTKLKPDSSFNELTAYLWPILKEMIKTNIENHQHLIIEGCYIPHDYMKSFNKIELSHIKMISIIFSKSYIEKNYDQIIYYSNIIEKRLDDDLDKKTMIEENLFHKEKCDANQIKYIYIEDQYDIDQIVIKILDLVSFFLYLRS